MRFRSWGEFVTLNRDKWQLKYVEFKNDEIQTVKEKLSESVSEPVIAVGWGTGVKKAFCCEIVDHHCDSTLLIPSEWGDSALKIEFKGDQA